MKQVIKIMSNFFQYMIFEAYITKYEILQTFD